MLFCLLTIIFALCYNTHRMNDDFALSKNSKMRAKTIHPPLMPESDKELLLIVEGVRIGLGLSRNEMAAALQMTPGAYSRWATRRRALGRSSLLNIRAHYPLIISDTLLAQAHANGRKPLTIA